MQDELVQDLYLLADSSAGKSSGNEQFERVKEERACWLEELNA